MKKNIGIQLMLGVGLLLPVAVYGQPKEITAERYLKDMEVISKNMNDQHEAFKLTYMTYANAGESSPRETHTGFVAWNGQDYIISIKGLQTSVGFADMLLTIDSTGKSIYMMYPQPFNPAKVTGTNPKVLAAYLSRITYQEVGDLKSYTLDFKPGSGITEVSIRLKKSGFPDRVSVKYAQKEFSEYGKPVQYFDPKLVVLYEQLEKVPGNIDALLLKTHYITGDSGNYAPATPYAHFGIKDLRVSNTSTN